MGSRGLRRFDADSGLIFHEIVQSAPRRCQCPGGLYDSHGTSGNATRVAKRVSKLSHMAMRRMLHNAESLTADGLRALPLHLLEQFWCRLRKRKRATLRTWPSIAAAASTDFRPRFSFECRCRSPMLGLVLDKISSQELLWKIDLALAHRDLTVGDFMAISQCPNLRSVSIVRTDTDPKFGRRFSYEVLRAWAEAARGQDALSTLTALAIWDYSITWRLFDFINSFPRLDTLFLTNQDWPEEAFGSAQEMGWTASAVPLPEHSDSPHFNKGEGFGLSFPAFRKDVSISILFGRTDSGLRHDRFQRALLFTRKLDMAEKFPTMRTTVPSQDVPCPPTTRKRKAVALKTMLEALS